MPNRNIEDCHTKNQAERSIDRAIETRKARAVNPLEETNESKVSDRAGNERRGEKEGEPGDPWRCSAPQDEPGACCDERGAKSEADRNGKSASRRWDKCRTAVQLRDRGNLARLATERPIEMKRRQTDKHEHNDHCEPIRHASNERR